MNNLLKLNGAIGPDDEDDNRPDDVSRMQGALTELGRTPFQRGFDPDEAPVREIERVQIDNNLMIDGRAGPGGPTERALNNELLRKRDEDRRTRGGQLSDPRVRKPVGMAEIGKSNAVRDLIRTEDALTRIGRPPQNEHQPTDLMRADAVGRSLMAMQSAADLERDGVMNPGGPTERELKRQLRKIDQLADAPEVSAERRAAPENRPADAGTSGSRGREPAEGVFTPAANLASGGRATTGTGAGEAALNAGDGIAGTPPGAGLLSQNEIDRKAATHFNRDSTFRVSRLSAGRFAFSDGRTGDAFMIVPRETGRALANAPGTLNGQNLDARLGMIRDGFDGAVTGSDLFRMAQALLIGGSGMGAGTAFGGLTDETDFDGERVEAFLSQIRKLRGGGLTDTERGQVTAAMMMTVFPRVLDGGESLTRFLMELMPGTGNVLSAVEAKHSFDASVAALRKGDHKGFLIAGGMTVLNAVGALPGVGNVAKPGIKLAQRGLFRALGTKGETFEDFVARREIPPSRAENFSPAIGLQKVRRRSLLKELRGLLGQGTWDELPRKTQQRLVGSYSNVAGPAVERYFLRRLEKYVEGTGLEIREQVSFKLPPGKKQDATKVDFGIASREEWMAARIDDGLNELFEAKAFQGTIFEIKGAGGGPKEAQIDLFGEFKDLGRADQYRFVGIPLSKVPPESLLEFAKLPRKLRAFPEALRRQLLEGLVHRLPRDYPLWAGMDLYARILAEVAREWFE